MAAPALVGSVYEGRHTSASTWTITITNGCAAGDTIVVMFTQEQSTPRIVGGVTDSAGNTYALEVNANPSTNSPIIHSYIYSATAIAAIPAGGTITITFSSGSATGYYCIQEIEPSTSAGLVDSSVNLATATSLVSGDTGLTTSGDVIIFCACGVNGTGTLAAAGGYTKLNAVVTSSHFQYLRSALPVTGDNGPWICTIARSHAACMAAFYAPSAGTPKSFLPPSRPTLFFRQRF